MRAAIYNPYLDTLGGGERYTTAFAQALNLNGYDVFIQWENPSLRFDLEKRFGINLSKITVIKDIKKGEGYDICFWVSDGSIPLLKAKKNYLHFQIPFFNVGGKSLVNRIKLLRIKNIICNSQFTKKYIDKEFGVKSEVLYPPIDIASFKTSSSKKNIILNISRFSQLTQSKNQHVLINAFSKLCQNGVKDWKLILAGGSEIGSSEYIIKLKKLAKGLPIEIIESPSFQLVKKLYAQSKIFWSAAGFGIDENKSPQKSEHFGIAVVEAMSAGAVPIVYNAGGHKESINNSLNGYLWSSESELLKATLHLIENPKELRSISLRSSEDAKNYSYEIFNSKVSALIK